MQVNILGTAYEVTIAPYGDARFDNENQVGNCDGQLKYIVVCDMATYPDEKSSLRGMQELQNFILRHEITHAFLFESGLADSSGAVDAWAVNEEMVDWIALQGPKIYKAWQEAGCV